MARAGRKMVPTAVVPREEGRIIKQFFEPKNNSMENSKGQNTEEQQSGSGRQDVKESGGMQNASANRGGTTDMDDEALTTGRRNAQERGSGVATKNTVTGSDYDGQL